ncbi:hypothetical protein [Mycobacterium seoulense]|uniref:hypothetical protein n=1 Tax=Mycobacterium seoulense TaxID=386911 RepID=UPI003CEFB2DD
MPTLENLTKLTALAAGAVFGALFNGYRTFYHKLGISPEQVGVTHTFILVRSVGFIVITGLIFAAWITTTSLVIRLMGTRRRTRVRVSYAYNFGFGLLFGVCIYACLSNELSLFQKIGFGLAVLFVSLLAAVVAVNCSAADRARIGLIVAALGAFLASAAFLQYKAGRLADTVNSDHPVTPYLFFTVPLLDVSSDPVRASWMCPEAQKPAAFRKNQKTDWWEPDDPTLRGMLIGESDKNDIIRLWDPSKSRYEFVSLPQNCTVLTRGQGPPNR